MKASSSLQINPLTELPVELGVMVACPGKERLVKVGARGRDAKDASALALAVSMAMCPVSLGACAMTMLSSLSAR